ncbi:MAG: hypothetical protein KC657_33415 [Myxococcales bacterium]|nr:hypothetical protein [Myxococcales bacterium]
MSTTYRARVRFRVRKKLRIESEKHVFFVDGREVELSGPQPDKSLEPDAIGLLIRDSEWLNLNARGFTSEEDAIGFARRLKLAVALSSVATRLGVDVGIDRATAALSDAFRNEMRKKTGLHVLDNVHGAHAFEDGPTVRIFGISARGTVHAAPDPFLSDLGEYVASAVNLTPQAANVVMLLNAALMTSEPVAQIVFSVSAVEMLGQWDQVWSDEQKRALKALREHAKTLALESERERNEVVESISKLTKLSLRQGVKRVLAKHGIPELFGRWDTLYDQRSKLFHGLEPVAGAEYGTLAHETLNLCGRILLKVVADEVPKAGAHVKTYYGG